MSYYISTLLVYLGVDIIACWALNLQYGVAGIYNFGFILFQALGAYTAAVLTLGSPTQFGGFQKYILGFHLPFPFPILFAGVAAGLLGLIVGVVTLRNLRADAQAMVLLVLAVMATLVVENVTGLFNGPAGLALVPQPFSSLVSSPVGYQWLYVGMTAAICAVVYVFVHRVTSSPLGRALRATRDNEAAAVALGKDAFRLKLFVFVLGCAMAGVSGAVLVEFITAWSPGSWLYVETLVVLTAIIVGGTGNNAGVMVGALLVPVGFSEATRYIPNFGRPGLVDAFQWVVIGLLALVFLWFRPQGVIPERRRRFPRAVLVDGNPALEEGSPPWRSTGSGAAALAALMPDKAPRGSDAILLGVQGLRRAFGGILAVDDASFDVADGAITSLIGPNGAGKSTVVGIIGGAIRPDSGRVTFDGIEITGLPPHERARLGLVRTYQLSSEFQNLTVMENLLVAVPRQRGERPRTLILGRGSWRRQEEEGLEKARTLLKRFDMAEKEDEYAGNLSGGQKRLVEIMRALMAEPRLLLLDEPMAGINPTLARTIESYLSDLAREGLAMLLVEHELEVVERLSSSVIMMAVGQVIATGTMAELLTKPEVVNAYLAG